MTLEILDRHNPLLFGANADEGLVAAEHVERREGPDEVMLFFRRGAETAVARETFRGFLVADIGAVGECPLAYEARQLKGPGSLNLCAVFENWADCLKARDWLARRTGFTPSAPGAPYLFLNDPVHQHLMLTGRTLFKGMAFEDLKRMQVDIECLTTEGYEFCNAGREGDRIAAVALSDQTGWVEVLSGAEMDEKTLLKRFVEIVRERDPDVIEGHNIFNFDLPYITERARRHKVKLALGRDGSKPRRRASRFSVGERTISYDRFEIHGRHIVDTLFLVHAYDISHRSLSGFGLKEVAIHFGLAADDRTYIEGDAISETFGEDPAAVMRYVADDARETRGLAGLLSRSVFAQAAMLPYSYQNVCVRGNATRIDALLMREYLRRGHALPMPDQARPFAGGYTDMFMTGVVRNVHHCDVRSLYPSLMLTRKIGPARDELGIFLLSLAELRDFRLAAKRVLAAARTEAERNHFDALQSTFKVLINSFYGYLGFTQGHFNDFDAAERVTCAGRELLRGMIDWLRKHGARPVEIDTDGIYFVPPREGDNKAFRRDFAASLPEGIEVEFDGTYPAMYSYKMKNYALLEEDGEIVIKGAALKSRGLEPFQREFLEEIIRARLEGAETTIPDIKARFRRAIENRKWHIRKLAKTERLQDSPATYAAKRKAGKRARGAAYELALAAERDYRAGDQLSFYVTGGKKSVAVHENAKLVSEWDPANRDENVPYYVAKLEALYKKFGGDDNQAELKLET